VINWMLEVEDVEDVACTVDDMEATDHSQYLVQRGWSEGRVEQYFSGPGLMGVTESSSESSVQLVTPVT
jgi:hypothetical protein